MPKLSTPSPDDSPQAEKVRSRAFGASVALTAIFAAASPAWADAPLAEASFCPERPGQTTPPCVVAPGQAMLEIGIAAWEHDSSHGEGMNQLSLASTTLRYGIAPRLEVQASWAGVITSSRFDHGTGVRSHSTNLGDLALGVLYGLSGPDGPIALQAFANLPAGSGEASAGEWSAGIRVPVAVPLGQDWQLGLTPEYDWAANDSGHGRHASFGGALGVSRPVSKSLSAGLDISLFRNDDPDGSSTVSTTSASMACQAGKDTQLDIGAGLGLTHESPRLQVYIGFARRL